MNQHESNRSTLSFSLFSSQESIGLLIGCHERTLSAAGEVDEAAMARVAAVLPSRMIPLCGHQTASRRRRYLCVSNTCREFVNLGGVS